MVGNLWVTQVQGTKKGNSTGPSVCLFSCQMSFCGGPIAKDNCSLSADLYRHRQNNCWCWWLPVREVQQLRATRFLNFKHFVEGLIFWYLWSFPLVPVAEKPANRFENGMDSLSRWSMWSPHSDLCSFRRDDVNMAYRPKRGYPNGPWTGPPS